MGCAPSSTEKGEFHADYKIGAKVAQGEISQVRIVRSVADGEDRVVKVIDVRRHDEKQVLRRRPDRQLQRGVQHEVRIWRRIGLYPNHHNVLRLMDVRYGMGIFYLVTEHAEYTLLYVLERFPLFDEQVVARVGRDALNALKHLHSIGIVHCDVHPDNFLCTMKPLTLKLAGFGCAQVLPPGSKGSLQGENGTPPFMSPEMLSTARYNSKTDIWSLGVMTYVLLFGHWPYRGQDKSIQSMKNAIKMGTPAPSYEPFRQTKRNCHVTEEAKDFCAEMLERLPPKRMSAEQALQHSFIAGADEPLPVFDSGRQSLMPMLCGALKAGAFYGYLCTDELRDADHLLNYMQAKYHGPIRPWTRERSMVSLLKIAMDKTRERDGEDATHPDLPMDIEASTGSMSFDVARSVGSVSTTVRALRTWGRGGTTETVGKDDEEATQSRATTKREDTANGVDSRPSSGEGAGSQTFSRELPSNRGTSPDRREQQGLQHSDIEIAAASGSVTDFTQVNLPSPPIHAEGMQGSRSMDARPIRSGKKNRSGDGEDNQEGMARSKSSLQNFRRGQGRSTASGAQSQPLSDMHQRGQDFQPDSAEDMQMARSLQRGLSSHEAQLRRQGSAKKPPRDLEENSMRAETSKKEATAAARDSSTWIHGFY